MSSGGEVTNDIQRSLGRVEGKLDTVLERLDASDLRLAGHQREDQSNFDAMHRRLNGLAIDTKGLQGQDENIRMIGKYILAIFATLTTLLGSAVVAALTGHLKID